jgi:hypothetical protein
MTASQEIAMDDIGLTDTDKQKRAARAPRKVTMKCLRNYRPDEPMEILGHLQPALIVKDAAGREKVVEPETFIKGVAAPPPQAGVGFANKVWAGTFIRVTPDEAKRMKATGVGEVEVD